MCACVYKHSKFLLDTDTLGFSGSERKLSLACRLGTDSLSLSEDILSLAFSHLSYGALSVTLFFGLLAICSSDFWQILAVGALSLDTETEI